MLPIKEYLVDQNGFGDFTTLTAASEAVLNVSNPVIIHINPGTYKESVVFERDNLTLEGASSNPEDVIIEDNHYAKEMHPDGFVRGTFWTAVLRIDGNNIKIKNLTVKNSSGPGKIYGQAIALYTDGLGISVENCRLLGHQDTLFTAPFPELNKHGLNEGFGPKQNKKRTPSVQCFKNCYIEGDVDFIFGGATVLFENCTLFSHEALTEGTCKGYIAAPCTVKDLEFGYLFYKCTLESNCPPDSVYLARPWRPYGKAVFIDCNSSQHIKSEMFNDWDDPANRNTAFFAVSNNMITEDNSNALYPEFPHIMDNDRSKMYVTDFKKSITNFFY